MNNWMKKAIHALAPAAGAAFAIAVPLFGSVSPIVIAKAAAGAFVAYLLKPARPAEPPAK